MSTLYKRLGGAQAVDAAVDKLYEKILSDDRINHFFSTTNMQQQIKHQIQFLTYAFGGAQYYSGNSLREAHKRLVDEMGLNDTHFDAVVENLKASLKELGIDENLIAETIEITESVRNDVLNKDV